METSFRAEDRIRKRITELEEQLKNYQIEAQVNIALLSGTIAELKKLLEPPQQPPDQPAGAASDEGS